MKKSKLAKATETLFNSFVKKYNQDKPKLLTDKEAQDMVNCERDLEYIFDEVAC